MHGTVGLQRTATRPTRRPRRTAGVPRPAGLAVAPAVRPVTAACALSRTARGWVVRTVVMAALAALLLYAAADDAGVPNGITVVEVQPGESLWELARRVAPQSPPDAVVARIRQLNGMHGATIHSGQPVLVPAAGDPAAHDTPS